MKSRGIFYEKGLGVTQDLERARGLYLQACKRGNKRACTGRERVAALTLAWTTM